MANQPNNTTTIDYIIGMPPEKMTDDTVNGRTQTVMENSMPIARIYPGEPSFTEGLNIFTRRPAFRGGTSKNLSYLSLLNSHKYDLKQPNYTSSTTEGCIVVAYLADSFPTDSFTNEYGENFLKSFTNIVSEGVSSVMQITGSRDIGDFERTLLKRLQEGGVIAQQAGKGIGAASDFISNISDHLFSARSNAIKSSLLAGGRLDFPMIWKGSSFQPSYTMTIRLYNPYPGDPESTNKYIAAPIAALLLLGTPISKDNVTYNYPFIHKIVSPGIYDIDPAFISNITIIKGGDQHQIAYNQNLGIVDVRIDFGSLYSSLLTSHSKNLLRPTLSSYIESMVGKNAIKTGVKHFSSVGITPELQRERDLVALERAAQISRTKNQPPRIEELTDEQKYNPPQRVTSSLKEKAIALKNKTVGGFL